jgi:hypothetical protein
MLSEVQTLTQIMNHVNRLPPQSRLRLVQLTLDTLSKPITSSFSKPTSDIEKKQNRFFHRLRGIATVKMSTDEIMSLRDTSQLTLRQGVSGNQLLAFAGCIEPGELQKMSQAIEDDCAKVDLNEWSIFIGY